MSVFMGLAVIPFVLLAALIAVGLSHHGPFGDVLAVLFVVGLGAGLRWGARRLALWWRSYG